MTWREEALFDPAEGIGAKGIAPDMDPAALGAGYLASAQNVRLGSGTMKVRPGTSVFQPDPLPDSGLFCGGAVFADSPSTKTAFAASYHQGSDETRIYACQFGAVPGEWGGWIECTSAGGKWGSTRFSGRPQRPFSFSGAPGIYGVGRILALSGMGSERPRVIRLSAIDEAPKSHPLAPPYGALADSPITVPAAVLDVAGGTWNLAGSGGFAAAVQQTSPNQALRFLAASGASAGSAVTASLGADHSVDGSDSSQIWLGAKCSLGLDGFKLLKIEVGGGSPLAWTTIYDPASGQEEIVQTDPLFGDFLIYAFPLPENAQNMHSWRSIRLTAVEDLPAGFQIDLALAASGGRVPVGAQHAIGFASSATGSESPGVVLLAGELAESANQDMLGRAARADSGGQRTASQQRRIPGLLTVWEGSAVQPVIPLDERLFCCSQAPIYAPTAEEAAKGADLVRIYRRDPGETEFSLVAEWPVARWNGSAWAPGAAYGPGAEIYDWGGRAWALDRLPRSDKSFGQRLPDGACTSAPSGTASLFANGRLYVASGQGSDLGAVWVSEEDQPFRFRETARLSQGVLDEAGGGVAAVGSEAVTALAATPGSYLGLSGVAAFTAHGVYRIEGLRSIKVMDEGCLSPLSISSATSSLAWLTTRRQAALAGSRFSEPSRNRVASALAQTSSDRLAWAASHCGDGKWLIAATPAGETENRIGLFYDLREEIWESIDLYDAGAAPAQFHNWDDKVCFWSADGRLHWWEDDEAADPLPIAIKSRSLSSRPGTTLRLRRVSVRANGPQTTLETLRSMQSPDSTSAGVIHLDEGLQERFDLRTDGGMPGARGMEASCSLSGSAQPGWELKKWTVEVQEPSAGTRRSG